jgi:hypothetical protein
MAVFYEQTEKNEKFKCKIANAGLGKSHGGGDQIEVFVDVLGLQRGKDYFPAEPNWPGRSVYLSLTEGTLGTALQPGWVAQLLKWLGFVGPSFSDLDPLKGKEVYCTVKHDGFSGEPKEKWSILRPFERAPMNPVPPQAVQKIDTKYAALVRSYFKPGSSPASPQPPRQPTRTGNGTRPPAAPPRRTEPTEPESEPVPATDDIPF